jgi:hypothetical protein
MHKKTSLEAELAGDAWCGARIEWWGSASVLLELVVLALHWMQSVTLKLGCMQQWSH